MNSDYLIGEGRRLARPCSLLRPTGAGPVAAIWHERDDAEIDESGQRCWLTIDSRFVPGLADEMAGFLSIYTDEIRCEGGRIKVHQSPPQRPGIELHASEESILPPIDAVFAHGSNKIGEWLTDNSWSRDERYNDNFRDAAIVREYERVWLNEYPLYRQDNIYAVLGGWHWPCADDDWHRLLNEQFIVMTIHDSEPWVEGWRLQSGQFRVVQRIS